MSISLLQIQVEKSRVAVHKTKKDKNDSSTDSSPGTCTDTVITDSQGWLHRGFKKIDALAWMLQCVILPILTCCMMVVKSLYIATV